MKKTLFGGLLVALTVTMLGSPLASAASTMNDLSWFGNTGATAMPVKDAHYSGYWWWPTVPESNSGDGELWGNRGVVYNMYNAPKPPAPVAAAPPAPPAAPAAPKVERSIPVFNHVLFDFDKSTLKDAGKQEVGKVAAVLKQYSGDTVTVEGHTCDLNGSGDPQYNTKLGKRRADTVAKALTGQGVGASRVKAVSKGESSPAVPNTSDANRKQNRRAVFVIKIGN